MLFTQVEFIYFFLLVFAFCLVVRTPRWRNPVLLVASYYFYGYWDWRFLCLIALCSGVNYAAALRIGAASSQGARKAWLVVAVGLSLGCLFWFKYAGFFVESFNAMTARWGWSLRQIDILLPVGISFFTFQTLSYTIDVYRGNLAVCRDPVRLFLFVAFFPQLVAGPIVRASDFLPQLDTPRALTRERLWLGLEQFVFGLFKKVFIADRMAAYVDYAYGNAGAMSGITLWLATICYAIQIYCDFSGYSDMAIGSARLLGYDFERNFNWPYLSRTITEFWRRWHISLSTWLRDYLYIPLGGNRCGETRTRVNLMLTMLLGGLWHGASWTFVFWGGLHGLALSMHKILSQRGRRGACPPLVAWLVTMLVVLVAWVFFRATSFTQAFTILRSMLTLRAGIHWFLPAAMINLALVAAWHLWAARRGGPEARLAPYLARSWCVLFLMVFLVLGFYPRGFRPFIYFQF